MASPICGTPLVKKSPTGEIMYCKNKASKARSDGTPCCGKHLTFVISKKDHSPDIDECNICLSMMTTKCAVTKLPCDHSFHKACIDKWAQGHNTCPCCRFIFKQDPLEAFKSQMREFYTRLDLSIEESRQMRMEVERILSRISSR